jgi:anti-sigma factor RsiW
VEKDRFRSKLSAYKDGELDGDLREQVSLHLRNCEACRKDLAEFEQVDSLVRGMPKLEPGEYFSMQIIAGIAAKAQRRPDLGHLSKRVLQRVLRLADPIFELISGHEHEETATLDEFDDFPPLSMSHAYFQVIGEQR